jgi:DNA-binding SARP family transcriptional activator
MLVRERLLARLRGRWFTPVTVLTAPAGYGKTTLLAQALAANAEAAVGIDRWLTCAPETSTLSALGEGLRQAVGARTRASTGAGSVTDIAADVVEALWKVSPQQVALVVDDVHEIPAGSEAAELLGAVLASLPANAHMVLAGRAAPPVALARLEVQGKVENIGESELAFTDDELAGFAALRNVRPAEVAGCGGWPALAELSASTRSGVAADYIGQEVLRLLSPDRRRHLALLAHVGAFDESLARAVLGPDVDVRELLSGLPLVSVVAEGTWSLHSLWRTLLTDHVTPADVSEARRQAGQAQLRMDRAGAAVRLLIDAQAWDDVAQAIVVALDAVHPPVARDVLEEWFDLLPPAARSHPSGRLLAAVASIEGDLGGAWLEFDDIAAAFRALGDVTGELACLLQLGQLAWWYDRPDRLANVAARVFEWEALGVEEAVPFACLGRAMIFDIADQSWQTLAELDRIPPGSLGESWQGIVSWAQAIAHLQLGNPVEAVERAEAALNYAGSLHTPLAQGTRLQALWYTGAFREVLETMATLLERVNSSGFRNDTALVGAQCATVHAQQGHYLAAANYLEQARAAAAMVPDAPLVDTNVSIAQAAVLVAGGDEESARKLLTAYVERHPIGIGLPVAGQRRHLALFYVLVPETRPAWDATELGPAWVTARALARALVEVRERRRLPTATPSLDDEIVVRSHLPIRWVAELGVAVVAAGREDGWRLLDRTWADTQVLVAGMTDASSAVSAPLRKAAREVVSRLPIPPDAHLELRLLGPVELSRENVSVRAPDWRRERVRSLLAHLALHGTAGRAQVAADLWPSLDMDAQSRNLRVTLTYLLRVLEPGRGPRDASFFIRQDGGNLSLHAGDWLSIDVWTFDTQCELSVAADRRGEPAAALDHALRAVELWHGEPTELLSDEWAVIAFEERRRRLTAVATRAGELLLARGNVEHALTLAEQVLVLDPWLEAGHRLVVATHQAAGSHLAARRALQRYRAASREVGLSPDEATLMVERLLDSLPEPRAASITADPG